MVPRSSDRLNDRYGHLIVLYILGALGLFFSAWLINIPGLALLALVLAINLVGDGIRDVSASEQRI